MATYDELNPYIVITTTATKYKCHGFSRKAGRVYFNSRAVNLANVVSIVMKDGSVAYANPSLKVKPVVKSNPRVLTPTKKIKDVIEI